MATANHPNQFALQQKVLYREGTGTRWRDGVIQGARVDDRTHRKDKAGFSTSSHQEECDTYVYVIRDAEEQTLASQEATTVTGCRCELRIADADATGRWHEQRLTDPESLALLQIDAERRGDTLTKGCTEDAQRGDLMYFQLHRHDETRPNVTLAWVTWDDLVAWASGIPAAE